jgi:4-hydroxy-tetrahydrodipicolinate synthase
MYEHFKAINEVGIPMMLYNIPGRCGGGGMTSATIAKLYELPNVCAIKEATGSVDFASEIRSCCDIQIFSGQLFVQDRF